VLNSKASSSNVYTKSEVGNLNNNSNTSLNNKADKITTYDKTETNVDLSILQAGIDTRVLINTVDINGRFKILTTTDNNFKIQRQIGTTLYDSLDLIFNDTDKTSILQVNNIDILSVLNGKASSSNVYTKEEINNFDIAFDNSLNNTSDKSNTYLKSEIDSLNIVLNNAIYAKANLSSIDLGVVYRLSKSTDNMYCSIDRFDNSGSINANAWISLVKLDFNDKLILLSFMLIH
jgi:hypothetical protein